MIKTDDILARNLRRATLDSIGLPDPVEIRGPFFHGTAMHPDEGVFTAIDRENSDFEAIWVSNEEWVSEMFAMSKQYEEMFPVVYRIGEESFSALPLDKSTMDEIMDFFGEPDPRDIIPHLEMAGYEAWTTLGSSGSTLYTDIAIFRDELTISEMKLFIDGKWTDYFSPSEFKEKLTGKMKSDHLERFTRVMHV